MRLTTNQFRLVTPDGGTVNRTKFEHFDDNPVIGREKALASIKRYRDAWSRQPALEGQTLTIVEDWG